MNPEDEEPQVDPEAEIIEEARERFSRAKNYFDGPRQLAEQDTRFALGDSDNKWQWPTNISIQRETDKKVMLTVNTTAQHCNQIINQIRQNRPAGKVSPIGGGAHKKSADIFAGMVRHVLASSNADDAHDVAAEHSIYGGEGFWRIVTEYESESSFDQVAKVKVIANPNRVYVDIDAKELDKSDAKWGFIFEDVNRETFAREYPDIKFDSWGDTYNEWIDQETFVRAEYFWCEDEEDTACMLADGTSVLKSEITEGAMIIQERPTKRNQWYRCFIVGGHELPIDKQEWPGAYLPIITVVGKEVNVNGTIVRKGVVRDLKDPARMVNYAYSETVQTLALQNKIPYIAAAEAIAGYEAEWQKANVSNDAYLPWNAYDDGGQQLPKPERQQPAVMPAAQIQLLQLSEQQMRAASGQQNSNFGIKSEAQSGIGIERLKMQGEIATFHFPDNLARGLKYEWKILIDLLPKITTRKQLVRVLGMDGKEDHAVLDPNMEQAYGEIPGQEGVQRFFNPNIGKYDVVIDTGPSYQTQRQESSERMENLVKAYPPLMQVAGDIIMRGQDFQASEELADRLEKTLPPGLADNKDGPEAHIAQLTQQLQQLQAESQQHIQEGLKLEQENQQLKHGQQEKLAAVQSDAQIKSHAWEVDTQMKQQARFAEEQMRAEQAQRDHELAAQKAEFDRQSAIQKAHIDAQLVLEKAQIDAHAKIEAAKIDAETKLIIAGMTTPPELSAKEDGKPVKKKTISIKTASGGMYQGEIDNGAVTITTPSGAIHSGTIH